MGHFGSAQCKDAAWEMVDGEESSGFTFYSIKFKSIIPGNWQQRPWCIFRQEFMIRFIHPLLFKEGTFERFIEDNLD